MPLEVLDNGQAGGLSFFPRAHTLGVVLPSNSPGVHSLWLPAIALKTALVLKPGSAEPWTPYRIIQAMIKAGAPPEAFHLLSRPITPAQRDSAQHRARHGVRRRVHDEASGPTIRASKCTVPASARSSSGKTRPTTGRQYIDVIAASIADNSGRSCVNASGVWTPRHAAAIAEALAAKLSSIEPRAAA